MGHASPWTEAVDETARVNWTAGISATACVGLIYAKHGVMLGRNAVIGRAHRQKWKTPTKPTELSGAVLEKRKLRRHADYRRKTIRRPYGADGSIAMRMSAAQRPPKFPKDTRPSKPDTTESRNMTLLELEPSQCRYPTSPDDVTSHLFCGRDRAEGSSYCEHHTNICSRGIPNNPRGSGLFPTRKSIMTHDLPIVESGDEPILPHGKTYSEHSGSSV